MRYDRAAAGTYKTVIAVTSPVIHAELACKRCLYLRHPPLLFFLQNCKKTVCPYSRDPVRHTKTLLHGYSVRRHTHRLLLRQCDVWPEGGARETAGCNSELTSGNAALQLNAKKLLYSFSVIELGAGYV